jgi:hypothetical protein
MELPMNATRTRSAVFSSATMLLVHGVLWVSWVIALVLVMPRVKHVLADYGMKVPTSTEPIVLIADLVSALSFLLLPLVIAFFIFDGLVLFSLRRRESTRMIFGFYSMLLIVLAFVAWVYSIGAILIPILQLSAGLSG